jgi:anti-anti-sigma factor
MNKKIEDGIMYLALERDLISKNVKQLNLKLMEYLDELDDVSEIILDMDKVDNIDSVGVTFVINLYKTVTMEGCSFRVVHCSEDIRQLFRLMKLEDFFELEG